MRSLEPLTKFIQFGNLNKEIGRIIGENRKVLLKRVHFAHPTYADTHGSGTRALDMGHRSQPKVQLYLRKPGINAGALPIAISLEERQTAP